MMLGHLRHSHWVPRSLHIWEREPVHCISDVWNWWASAGEAGRRYSRGCLSEQVHGSESSPKVVSGKGGSIGVWPTETRLDPLTLLCCCVAEYVRSRIEGKSKTKSSEGVRRKVLAGKEVPFGRRPSGVRFRSCDKTDTMP